MRIDAAAYVTNPYHGRSSRFNTLIGTKKKKFLKEGIREPNRTCVISDNKNKWKWLSNW